MGDAEFQRGSPASAARTAASVSLKLNSADPAQGSASRRAPPAVAVASLDESAVTINLRPWATCADYWAVYSGAQRAVKEAFDKNGVRIPFQQIDVHQR